VATRVTKVIAATTAATASPRSSDTAAVRVFTLPSRRVFFGVALLGLLSLPLPAGADALSDHLFASFSAVMSATLGPDALGPLASEAEASTNLEVRAGWRNLYPSGGTFITALAARRSGLFPERGNLTGGGLGSILVPGDDSHERYQLIQEFDNPGSGVERFEAAIGTSSWHGTTPYRTHYVAVDYYAGSISRFGFDGRSRRFDLYASYLQTSFGHLVEISPTYSLPLDSHGRTAGWASLTLDAPIGRTPERYAGVDLGVMRQLSRRASLAISTTRYWARDETGIYSQHFELSAGARVKW